MNLKSPGKLRVLVTIASYGQKNIGYLKQVIQCYRFGQLSKRAVRWSVWFAGNCCYRNLYCLRLPKGHMYFGIRTVSHPAHVEPLCASPRSSFAGIQKTD